MVIGTMARARTLLGWVVAACALLTAEGCAGRPPVVRVVDGREVAGRYVHPEAYARFFAGAVAEQQGQWRDAERAYASALRFDRGAVGILTRLGAVVCAQPGGVGRARAIFEEALSCDEHFGPAYLERAKCAERAGDLTAAEGDAREALRVEPYDPEVTLVLARVLERRGRGEDAARALEGYGHGFPGASAIWRAALALAERRGDWLGAAGARGMLARAGDELGPFRAPAGAALVDDALRRGDLGAARRQAVSSSMAASEVALRAAGLGRWDLALEQAQLVLSADPGNPDAVATWYASPEPSSTDGRLELSMERRLMEIPRGDSNRSLSVLGALVLADGLRRRMGADVASAFLRAYGPHEPRDALAGALLRRLRAGGAGRGEGTVGSGEVGETQHSGPR